MARKRTIYTVRVIRAYAEEYVDIDVEAKTEGEAREEAIREVRANASLYFGSSPDPEFFIDDVEEQEHD